MRPSQFVRPEAVYRRSRSLATRELQIGRAGMGKSAGLVGAAVSAVDELFSWDHLRSWIEVGSPVLLNQEAIVRASEEPE